MSIRDLWLAGEASLVPSAGNSFDHQTGILNFKRNNGSTVKAECRHLVAELDGLPTGILMASHIGEVAAVGLDEASGDSETLSRSIHDFNNLLMVIQSYAELMGYGELTDQQRRHLTLIVEAAFRASDMTRTLLGSPGMSSKEPLSASNTYCLDLRAK